MNILPASPEDHERISIITKRSKAYWGYSPEQIKLWDDVLTISADYINKNIVWKYIEEEKIVAYYTMLIPTEKTITLDYLFVLPEAIGKGIGKQLLEHAFVIAAQAGHEAIILYADPHAENFYAKFGFEVIGQKSTTIPGRFLPIMKKNIKKRQ